MCEKIFISFSLSSFDSLTLPVAASRTVKLGGTVATVGFPDIGLPDFLTTKYTKYTKKRQIHFVSAFVCFVYFVVKFFVRAAVLVLVCWMRKPGNQEREFIHGFMASLSTRW
jgi:hypothetical protein